MATKSIWRSLCTVILAVTFLLSGTVPCSLAADNAGNSTGHTKKAEVTIQKKMRGGLLTKELRAVRVGGDTEYTDQTGKRIQFESLAAPCKAAIVYDPIPNGDPVAVSVTVREFLPGATSRLSQSPE